MEVKYIEHAHELETVVGLLAEKPRIAIDLEFDKNRYQYGFTMCLMQIYDGDDCYIIDPLSRDLDVSKTFSLIENPGIMKLGFELGEDLRLLKLMGADLQNFYDISIASKLLDHAQISLVNAIERILGVETSKSSQKSNWLKRPLSAEQIKYASEDVIYLFDLFTSLDGSIQSQDMGDWVEQERRLLERMEVEEQTIYNYVKRTDSKGVSKLDWHVFLGLLQFREDLAKQSNRPAYQVMDKSFLLDVAQNPKNIRRFQHEAKALRSLRTAGFQERLAAKALQLRKEGEAAGLDDGPVMSEVERQELRLSRDRKRREDALIDKFLKPIQASMKESLGENAAVYVMGNRLMRSLANGFSDDLLPYKRDLLIEHATIAGVDLTPLHLNLEVTNQ